MVLCGEYVQCIYLHFDLTEVAVAVLDHACVLLAVKHGSHEPSHLPRPPPSHGGLGWVQSGGDEVGQYVSGQQSTGQL